MAHRPKDRPHGHARHIQRPMLLRMINRIGPLLASAGLGRVSLEPEALQRVAVRRTGLSDFGEDDFEEGLARLTESLEHEANLNYGGRLIARQILTRRLSTRLLTEETLRRFPEFGRRKTEKPTLVIGFPRTGTTLLYNLLALAPSARSPRLWEVHFPAPPPATLTASEAAQRIRFIDRRFGGLNTAQLRRKHTYHSATAYEECYPLLEPCFVSPTFGLFFNLPAYTDWLRAQPVSTLMPTCRYYSQQVNLLMHGHEGKRWLSKSPAHAFLLPALARVFADAQIVQTHRDPSESIPSLCSLMMTVRGFFSDPKPEEVGRTVLLWHEETTERFEEVRKAACPPNVIDIDYRALVADPIGTVGGIHDHFGLPLCAQHESAMQTWLGEKNPWDPGKHDTHVYSAAEFGLDEAALRRLAP